jgi:hypothetical protein
MQFIREITEHCYRYILPKVSPEEEQEVEPIPAQEVIQAVKTGKSIEIINAVIEGPLTLESIAVTGKIAIKGTRIKGRFDFSYAECKQVLDFHSTTFLSEVNFTGATITKDIILQKTTFHEKADFTDMIVEGALYGESCKFLNEVDFTAAQIKRRAVFIKGIFENIAMFTGFNISGTAYFHSTTFLKAANFGSAHIKGRAIFEGAIFEDNFDFASGRIGACAEFKNSLFKKNAVFHRTQIEESAFFQNTNFEGDVDFGYIRIGSNAEFNGAVFHKTAIFNSAIVEGHTLFNSGSSAGSQNDEQVLPKPTIFKGKADFSSVVFLGGATFLGARFFENVDFFASRIDMNAGFTDVVFFKNVDFLNASFGTLFFSKYNSGDMNNQFNGRIDLRGCTYNRFEPISVWEQLMEHLYPYHRQPYTQLENTLLLIGEDQLAKKVYYKRKCTEFSIFKKRNPLIWLGDRFLWLLTGYGVKLWRLLLAIVLILAIGTLIFQLKGAVEPNNFQQMLSAFKSNTETRIYSIGVLESFWVTLKLFLPIPIAAGATWLPSSEVLFGIVSFTAIATFLQLAGWILVPLAVAGLSGWLKR